MCADTQRSAPTGSSETFSNPVHREICCARPRACKLQCKNARSVATLATDRRGCTHLRPRCLRTTRDQDGQRQPPILVSLRLHLRAEQDARSPTHPQGLHLLLCHLPLARRQPPLEVRRLGEHRQTAGSVQKPIRSNPTQVTGVKRRRLPPSARPRATQLCIVFENPPVACAGPWPWRGSACGSPTGTRAAADPP